MSRKIIKIILDILFDYEIKEVDYEESLKFYKENSIFNSDDFDKSFGLYQDDELIQLISLKGNKIVNYLLPKGSRLRASSTVG